MKFYEELGVVGRKVEKHFNVLTGNALGITEDNQEKQKICYRVLYP
jgi:hypothetical protein